MLLLQAWTDGSLKMITVMTHVIKTTIELFISVLSCCENKSKLKLVQCSNKLKFRWLISTEIIAFLPSTSLQWRQIEDPNKTYLWPRGKCFIICRYEIQSGSEPFGKIYDSEFIQLSSRMNDEWGFTIKSTLIIIVFIRR